MIEVTKKFQLYGIDELNGEIQNKAYADYLYDFRNPYDDDYKETLDAFCKLFGVTRLCYEQRYGRNHFYFSFDIENATTIKHCRGYRINKYLNNNNNYYDKFNNEIVGIEKLAGDCLLTGAITDNAILAPVVEVVKYKAVYNLYYDLIGACLRSLFDAWSEETDYLRSFDCFREECNDNGYLFDIDGNHMREFETI